MKLSRGKKILVFLALLVVLVGIGGGLAWFRSRPEPPDTRFTGAYRLGDGRLAIVTPREGPTLRLRIPATGESLPLFPVGSGGELRFEVGTGWNERTPVDGELRFEMGQDGRPRGFTWAERSAVRLDLPEEGIWIRSGDLRLRGKLVVPLGPGPHPGVVLVHGSEAYSAVDFYPDPYLFAAHGLATLVFDKRGTGGSDGTYTQNFHVLARDVVAAVAALRRRPEVDAGRIQLEGGSQAGWIIPLAAAEDGRIESLLVDYGPMVAVAQEDRWGYVYQLREKGFGEEAIRQADRLQDALDATFRHREGAWGALGRARDRARGTDWFEAARGSDSALGFLADHPRVPLWAAPPLRLVEAPAGRRRTVLRALLRPGADDGRPRRAEPLDLRWRGPLHAQRLVHGSAREAPGRGAPHPDPPLSPRRPRHRPLPGPSRRHSPRPRLRADLHECAQVAWLRYQSGLDPTLDQPAGAPPVR